MSKFIMLTKDEAQAILKELSAHQLATIFNKEHLISAIAKLDSDGEELPAGSAFCGSSAAEEETEKRWTMFGDKIMMIKSIRNMSGYGLKEAKDFVDARIGHNFNGLPGIGFFPSELGLNGSHTYEFRKAGDICNQNHITLSAF